jgi:hypothetical protein
VILTVKADLEVLLDVDPRYVNFGVVARRSGATRSVDLIGPDGATTKPLGVTYKGLRTTPDRGSSKDSVVQARLAGEEEPGAVVLSLAPDAPLGLFDGIAVIETDHPKLQQLSVRVRGTVTGDVTYRPQFLTFRNLEAGTEQTRLLTVQGSGDEPLEILEVASSHPALAATFSDMGNGRTRVSVTCNGELGREREIGQLVIRTSSEEDPRVEVPVHMFRLKRPDPRPVRPPAGRPTPPPPTGD